MLNHHLAQGSFWSFHSIDGKIQKLLKFIAYHELIEGGWYTRGIINLEDLFSALHFYKTTDTNSGSDSNINFLLFLFNEIINHYVDKAVKKIFPKLYERWIQFLSDRSIMKFTRKVIDASDKENLYFLITRFVSLISHGITLKNIPDLIKKENKVYVNSLKQLFQSSFENISSDIIKFYTDDIVPLIPRMKKIRHEKMREYKRASKVIKKFNSSYNNTKSKNHLMLVIYKFQSINPRIRLNVEYTELENLYLKIKGKTTRLLPWILFDSFWIDIKEIFKSKDYLLRESKELKESLLIELAKLVAYLMEKGMEFHFEPESKQVEII